MKEKDIIRTAERFLKRTEAYQQNKRSGVDPEENFQILFILVKGNKIAPEDVFAVAVNVENSIITYHPYRDNDVIEDWSFNFDSDFFEYLERDYQPLMMTLSCHYNIWATINDWYQDGIEGVDGMHKYLDYCRDHEITVEKLQKELGYHDGDIMDLVQVNEYDRKTDKESDRSNVRRDNRQKGR